MAQAISPAVIDLDGLGSLVEELRTQGYTVVGPTKRDGAIVYAEIEDVAALPRGIGDEQDAGRYRLVERGDDACFGYANAPQSWRRFLFEPQAVLFRARRDGANGFLRLDGDEHAPRYAFLGVRACELAAISVQDRVFLDPAHPDPRYGVRRRAAFVVAVQCGSPAGTCFCVSMGTGPKAETGFDLALTELVGNGRHDFVVEVGSPKGASMLSRIASRPADGNDLAAAADVSERATSSMGRSMDTTNLPERLAGVLEHPHWDDVASRCLGCANCTLVCPTCFCSKVSDVTDLSGKEATRERTWDSCFTLGHSYLHGGSVRATVRDRYRQWMTHKLSTWVGQFGTSGCVGCGRCIAWCPAGIDITSEVRQLLAGQPTGSDVYMPPEEESQ